MLPSVAIYVGSSVVIVASRHATPDGIVYEQDSPVVLKSGSAADIGAAVKQAFGAFSIRTKNLRDLKASDWPAFQASGCRSIKQFATEFRAIFVGHLNSSGMVARAELAIPGDADFAVSTTFNPRLPDEEVGRCVLGVVDRGKRAAL